MTAAPGSWTGAAPAGPTDSSEPTDSSGPTATLVPGWFEALVAGVATTLAVGGLVGLAAALFGGYRSLPVVALALLAGAVVGVGVVRLRSEVHVPRSAHVAAGAALVIAVAFTAWASWAPSHHVLINRDPGSYSTTARWLVRDGGLDAPARVGGLEDEQLLRIDGFAVYDVGDGRVEFQFTHLSAVALAAAYDLGGPGVMFRLPAAVSGLGLLAVYAVAARASRRRFAALVAPALLAVSLPMVFVSRDTYSEPFAFGLVWSAVLLALVAAERHRPWVWSVSGLLGGAALAARPDLVVTLVALGPLLVLHLAALRRDRSRGAARAAGVSVAAGLGAGAMVGGVDLWTASGGYVDRHGGQIAIGAIVAAAATAVTAIVAPSRLWGIRDRWVEHRDRFVVPIAVAGVAVLVAAWWLRPELQTMTGPNDVPLIGGMQSAEGLAVESTRRYGEYSMVWMSWYLGAGGLIAAIAGFGVALARSVNGTAGRALLVVTVLFAAVGAVTLWRPVITPDQVWASRRFVPVVLPSLAVLVAVAVAALLAAGAIAPGVRRTLAGVVVAMALLGAAATTWPVRSLREQHGFREVLEQACGLVGDDASVVVLGRPEVDVLPQSMRSWCGVPVAAAANGVGAADLDPVLDAIRGAGRTPVLVSRDPDALTAPSGGGPVASTTVAVETRRAERTLMRPPSSYAEPGDRWSLSVRRLDP